MPPYPLTPSKDMLPLEEVDRSNKRRKLEETYLSFDGISSVFSIKEEESNELPSYEWTSFPEDFINFEIGFEEISSVGSTENEDVVFTDSDIFSSQETPSVKNTEESKDIIDTDSLLEIAREIPDSTLLEASTDADEEISWLDFVAMYDVDGKKCRKEDIPARKVEIMEELEMISRTVQQMKEETWKQEELSLYPKKAIQKIKVDCPNCRKKVAAVRFVPHLSKCFGNGARKCTRQ